MKTIDTYIKEAFITKTNIAKTRKANLQFPDVDFEEGSDEDAKVIEDWLCENNLMPDVLYSAPDEPNGHWLVELGTGRIVHYILRYKFTTVKFAVSVIDIGPDYVKRTPGGYLRGSNTDKYVDELIEIIKNTRNIQ